MTIFEEARLLIDMPLPAEAKAIREASRLSVARLAAQIGVTRYTLHSWEAGTSTPRGDNRLRYARVLADLKSVVETV